MSYSRERKSSRRHSRSRSRSSYHHHTARHRRTPRSYRQRTRDRTPRCYRSRSRGDRRNPSSTWSRPRARRTPSPYRSRPRNHDSRSQHRSRESTVTSKCIRSGQEKAQAAVVKPQPVNEPDFPELWGTFLSEEMVRQMEEWRLEAEQHFDFTLLPRNFSRDSSVKGSRKRGRDDFEEDQPAKRQRTAQHYSHTVYINKDHPNFKRLLKMKRQKGQKPKAEDIKRQKSQTENSQIPDENRHQDSQVVKDNLLYSSQLTCDNLQPDPQRTCDNLQLDSQQTSVKQRQESQPTSGNQRQYNQRAIDNLQHESQLATDKFQQDSTLANNNLQTDGQENKKTVTHRVNDNCLALAEDENPLKTTDGKDVNAVKPVNRISDSFKSTCNENKMKLEFGFGFTKTTSQYRISENCKPPTSSSNDKNNGQCFGKNRRRKAKRMTSVDGNINGSNSSLSTEDAKQENSVSACFQVVLPEGMKGDKVMDDSQGGNDLQLTQTDRIFKTQQLSTCDVDMDAIYTRELQQEKLDQAPKQASADYVDMSPQKLPTMQKIACFQMIPIGKQKPDQESNIVIPHKNADTPEGDDFGAKLCTFIEKRKDGSVYYRQFLMDVDDAGPAGQMGIENNDELVLCKDVFVPVITHTDVLNLFHGVPVDGKTRFTLVVRRVERKCKWEWIETSAILAANKTTDEGPIIEYPEYRRFRGRIFEVAKSRHLYKVPGTQKYLDISDRGICIDTISHDATERTKIIWKRAKYWQADSEGHLDFAYALCDVTMKLYIAVEKQNYSVILKNSPDWFKMITVGSTVRFQFQDKYLGYDRESGHVNAQTGNCVFEELPAPVLRSVDTHTASLATVSVPIGPDVSDIASSNIFQKGSSQRGSSSSNDDSSESDAKVIPENKLDGGSAASNEDLESVSEIASSKMLEICSSTNDNNETSEISSYLSRVDSFSCSQTSNISERSAAESNDSHYFGPDSSGYGSGSLTPPESIDVETSVDRDFSKIVNHFGTASHPKTPTAPMEVLSLSEKVTLNI